MSNRKTQTRKTVGKRTFSARKATLERKAARAAKRTRSFSS